MSTRKLCFILGWLLALLLVPTTAWLQGPVTLVIDEIKAENFPNIEAYATVFDANGVPIQGLDKTNFEVLEDGKVTPIKDVNWRVNEEAVIAVALVIDVSGSMRGKPLDDAKKAAISFIDSLNPNDLVAVIAFGDAVDLGEPFPRIDPAKEMDFTFDHGALKNLINSLEAKEKARTPLYDAAFKAVKMTARQPFARRAVILFTDGKEVGPGERASIMGPEDPIREANRNRIPIFTIGLGEDIDRAYLKRVASGTGGIYEETPDSAKLEELFLKIGELLKHQYIIRYTSQALADGKEHSLLLRVKALGSQAEGEETFLSKRIMPIFDLPPIPAELSQKMMVTVDKVIAQGGVVKIEFLLDGKVIHTASSVPCSYNLDPTTIRPGDHTLTVRAYDPAGNIGVKEVSFKVPGPMIPPLMLPLVAILALLVVGAVFFFALQRRRRVYMPEVRPPTPIEAGAEFPTEAGVFRGEEIPPTQVAFLEAEQGLEIAPTPAPTVSLKPERRHLAFLVIEKGEPFGREFRLHEGDTLIGRSGTCDIVLSDPTVSRQHAKIRLEGEDFYIYDLGATNPTRVNGQEITKHKLMDGDRIEIGNIVLVFKRA